MSRTLETTTSPDGTTVTFEKVGSGPAVVVLPGAMNTAESWRAVGAALADRCTVHVVNRRFYAPSGAGPTTPSSFAVEAQDVHAVIAAAGGSAHVVGHSYGALLALHTALADPTGIRSLLLYEAPATVLSADTRQALASYRARLAANDHAGAVMLFLESVAKVPQSALAELAAADPDPDADPDTGGSSIDQLRALATALEHDIESLSGAHEPATAFEAITPPVLLAEGDRTWADLRESSAALRAALPNAETVTWRGQSHFANVLAPAVVADTIAGFVQRVDGVATTLRA